MERVFAVLDVVWGTPGYDEICAQAVLYQDANDNETTTTCEITSPARFYQYDTDMFRTTDLTNQQLVQTLFGGRCLARAHLVRQTCPQRNNEITRQCQMVIYVGCSARIGGHVA